MEPTSAPTTAPTEHVHEYALFRVVEPTCVSEGYSVYTCLCGDSYTADPTPVSDNHDYFTVLIPPSTAAEGYTRHICRDCGYEYRDNYTARLPEPTTEPTTAPTTAPTTEPTTVPTTDPNEDVLFNLVHGLQITDIGSYSGPFLENGSDQPVEDVLMIQLCNTGSEDLQVATILLTGPSGTAVFEATTIPAGASVILLEKNAMTYTGEDFSVATAENVVFFAENLSIQSDKIKLQGLDGALNVTNISGAPISGTIEIYYKNFIDGQLYGGITYVASVTGGLADGEVRQVMTGHFSVEQSAIMFIRIVE